MQAATQDRESQKKIISEYLKAADRYIKSAEFPKALDEVKKALGVEPNNMYATAYNERVKVAMEAARKKEEEERLKKQAEEQKKSSAGGTPKPAETAARATNAPDAKPQPAPGQSASPSLGDDMIAKIKKDASDAAEKRTDGRVGLLKQEFSSSQQGKGGTSSPSGGLHDRAADLLGKLFKKAWEDGIISPDERGLLTIVKNESGMSEEDFAKIENESGASSYIAHLRDVWEDGVVTPEEAETLVTLRKTLHISAEEHFKLEAQVRKEMQAKK